MAFLHPISKAVSDFKKVRKHGFGFSEQSTGYIYMPANQFHQQNKNPNKPPQGQTFGVFSAVPLFLCTLLLQMGIPNSEEMAKSRVVSLLGILGEENNGKRGIYSISHY